MVLIKEKFVEAWKNNELKVGGITLLEDRVVVVFKKEVEEKKAEGYASKD
ncbi:MAG: hypothetical protein QXJ19_03545 [Candidatus Bathyarchaeia archaeon]|nr:hypothetical protein [Candidatus Bathyarchaeota archaeon]